MWKISASILLGFTILACSYAWINRHQFIQVPATPMIQVINKWTSETCVIVPLTNESWASDAINNGLWPCPKNELP